jgi:hypothetical protein
MPTSTTPLLASFMPRPQEKSQRARYVPIASLNAYIFCCALFPHASRFSMSRNGFTAIKIGNLAFHCRLCDIEHFCRSRDSPSHPDGTKGFKVVQDDLPIHSIKTLTHFEMLFK